MLCLAWYLIPTVCMLYWHLPRPPALSLTLYSSSVSPLLGVRVCSALQLCPALSSILRGSFLSSFMFITNACQSVSLFFFFLLFFCANKNISNMQKKKPHTHAHHAQLAITQKHLLHSRPRKQLQLAWRGGTGVSGARKPGLGNCAQLVEACSGRRNSSNGCNR